LEKESGQNEMILHAIMQEIALAADGYAIDCIALMLATLRTAGSAASPVKQYAVGPLALPIFLLECRASFAFLDCKCQPKSGSRVATE
jgi:hypothetical protein